MSELNETIQQQLAAPLHPDRIIWKPGATNKDKSRALAMPYADMRAYMARLDEVCGLDWSVKYTPWEDGRLICELTINGVTRSSIGEPDGDRSGNAGTAAEAQAFKRACVMFGLGRYLYSLPSVWVGYDAKRRQFTDAAQRKLDGIVTSQYKRHGSTGQDNRNGTSQKAPANGTQRGVPEEADKHYMRQGRADDDVQPKPQTVGYDDNLRKQLHAVGTDCYDGVYEGDWEAKRAEMTQSYNESMAKKHGDDWQPIKSSNEWPQSHARKVIAGMNRMITDAAMEVKTIAEAHDIDGASIEYYATQAGANLDKVGVKGYAILPRLSRAQLEALAEAVLVDADNPFEDEEPQKQAA